MKLYKQIILPEPEYLIDQIEKGNSRKLEENVYVVNEESVFLVGKLLFPISKTDDTFLVKIWVEIKLEDFLSMKNQEINLHCYGNLLYNLPFMNTGKGAIVKCGFDLSVSSFYEPWLFFVKEDKSKASVFQQEGIPRPLYISWMNNLSLPND